ncbi:hypothetical protein WCLP8_4470002 [uncultured Gammaproteobacteria bacterium]
MSDESFNAFSAQMLKMLSDHIREEGQDLKEMREYTFEMIRKLDDRLDSIEQTLSMLRGGWSVFATVCLVGTTLIGGAAWFAEHLNVFTSRVP